MNQAFSEQGFVFYTNYLSRKSKEITENPNASLVFYWDILEKVVKIEGKVEKVSEEESTKYFHSRPRESQIGAWASHYQSQRLESRVELEEKSLVSFLKQFPWLKCCLQEYKMKFKDKETIPRPEFWGGWILKPIYLEFWYKLIFLLP